LFARALLRPGQAALAGSLSAERFLRSSIGDVRDVADDGVRGVIPTHCNPKEQTMKRMKTLATGILLLGQTLSGAAFAASVTLAGTTVDFTFDDALLGLFGPASVAGDTLYFTPVAFRAQSLNGAGFALANDTMNVRVAAHGGWSFAGMDLLERGDYLLLGAGSMADVGGQIRVFDVASPLAELDASISASAPLDLSGLPTHNWQAAATLDLSAWNDAQTLNVTIQNLLLASTGASPSLAFIEKKFVGLTPAMLEVTPVPEAETYAMMLAGLGLVGWAARRRRGKSEKQISHQ